jgi:hypothetical protein
MKATRSKLERQGATKAKNYTPKERKTPQVAAFAADEK